MSTVSPRKSWSSSIFAVERAITELSSFVASSTSRRFGDRFFLGSSFLSAMVVLSAEGVVSGEFRAPLSSSAGRPAACGGVSEVWAVPRGPRWAPRGAASGQVRSAEPCVMCKRAGAAARETRALGSGAAGASRAPRVGVVLTLFL